MTTIKHVQGIGQMLNQMGLNHGFEIYPDHIWVHILKDGKLCAVMFRTSSNYDQEILRFREGVCRALGLEQEASKAEAS